jgi:PAS domain S-box-containing protein
LASSEADPSFASFLREGAAVLVWSGALDRILWASAGAMPLLDALAREDGTLRAQLPSLERLKGLAAGLSPDEGLRLERLRLDPSRYGPPVTCACRVGVLPNGERVVVTAVVGALPKLAPRLQVVAPSPAAAPSNPAPGFKPSGTVRFVWQADASGCFTHVAPALAEVVGPVAGNILGRTFADLAATIVVDEGGVAGLMARHETFSGRPLLWAVDGTNLQVPVDWAGLPVYGPDKALAGYRGFGLLRTDAARERPTDGAPAADEAAGALETLPAPDSWFAGIRERVAATLAGGRTAKADGPPEAPKPEPRSRPAAPMGLSATERSAFRDIARALGARFEDDPKPPGPAENPQPARSPATVGADRILERLPLGAVVHRDGRIAFANRLFLDIAGYGDLGSLEADGGLAGLFRSSPGALQGQDGGMPVALAARGGESVDVEVRHSSVDWEGSPASLMLVRRISEADVRERLRAAQEELAGVRARVTELEAILDTATDGVIVLDETGRILSLNRSAEALFGYDDKEVVGDAITVLLAPESHIVALGYLEGLRQAGVASLLNDGREVWGRVRQGGTIPLFMTMGRANEGAERKFCAVLRDITAFKKAEGELIAAKRAAEEASAQKSDLLAKISHEIRTPLNAIIGFAEVMIEERFGAVGNERYRDYLKDVHASGTHVISLVNDLLDLAKIEAGRMELNLESVQLNDLVGATVALLQQQASRDRIVMRTSFAPRLPTVSADERSLRQIVLNLVSNAIKFTDAGGQVIVSTAVTDRGEVAFRVRDTGIGMTDDEIEQALEPFRQLATARKGGGTGLGLPLTKALVEANRGAMQISSNPNEGTLVEVLFPPMRVLAR